MPDSDTALLRAALPVMTGAMVIALPRAIACKKSGDTIRIAKYELCDFFPGRPDEIVEQLITLSQPAIQSPKGLISPGCDTAPAASRGKNTVRNAVINGRALQRRATHPAQSTRGAEIASTKWRGYPSLDVCKIDLPAMDITTAPPWLCGIERFNSPSIHLLQHCHAVLQGAERGVEIGHAEKQRILILNLRRSDEYLLGNRQLVKV